MKVLQGLTVAWQALKNSPYTAFQALEKTLQALEFPDVGGVPIASVADQNLETDGQGNIAILPDLLADSVQVGVTHPAFIRRHPTGYQLQYSNDEGVTWSDVGSLSGVLSTVGSPLQIGTTTPVYLRNNAQVLEFSNDGTIWTAVGQGDMLKSVYDITDSGHVDLATAIIDGVGTLNADGIRALIPAPADTSAAEIALFMSLVSVTLLMTEADGWLKLPGGLIDAFQNSFNQQAATNATVTTFLTQTDYLQAMSCEFLDLDVESPTQGTVIVLAETDDFSKISVSYQDEDEVYHDITLGTGQSLLFSGSRRVLYKQFDLVGTIGAKFNFKLDTAAHTSQINIFGMWMSAK